MTTSPRPHAVSPRSSDLLLETVVGRFLEWMVHSVEGVRAKLRRRR